MTSFSVSHELRYAASSGVEQYTSVNKFGRAPSGVQTTATDIWDRADATPTQQVWTAPTEARVHTIAGTANDTLAGTHAQKIQVYGLTDWDTPETSEKLDMNGAGGVNTTNSYVIIHRMKVIQWGTSETNGLITATALTDATVTAQINADEGQTQMAIYGIPSTKTAYMSQYYFSINRAAAAARADVSVLINPAPDARLGSFQVKHTQGCDTTGTSYFCHKFDPMFKISGPAIIKIQSTSSAADIDGSAGFDMVLT